MIGLKLKNFFNMCNNALVNFGKKISKITNPVLLFLFYVVVVGLTWLYTVLAGIKAIDINLPDNSTWVKVDVSQPTEKDCLNQW